MKTLIVDNGSTLIQKLSQLIPGEKSIVEWDNIGNQDLQSYGLIVLSGGSKFNLVGNENKFSAEMALISSAKIPVIGICYGCEIIVETFGGTLEEMAKQEKGIIDIKILQLDVLFNGKDTVRVYENHQWRIKSLPPDFIALAESIHGIEVIKHKSLPIYGLQFHPENFVDQTEGDEVFLRIFNSFL